ncbi:beta-phosphoglucomutase [Hydrogenispora ethanolica]|nr:beta-phosphoglucomutase [Hydrogenispora ethanolica]
MSGISRQIKAFLFDMDGVITDTVEYHYQSWKKLCAAEDIPFTAADNRDLLGLSREDSLQLLLDRYHRKVSPEHFRYLYERKNQLFLELVAGMTAADLLPGVREFLDELAESGLKIAVASSSRNTQCILERLGIAERFAAIVNSSMVERAKPAPDLFLHAAAQLQVVPEEAVVIEDSAAGISAAHQAGMLVVGIGPREQVGPANLIFPSLAEVRLPSLVAALQNLREVSLP